MSPTACAVRPDEWASASAETLPRRDRLIGGDVPNRTCSIRGCELPHSGRGWCATHYQRWKRYGDPLVQKVARHTTRLEYLQHYTDGSAGPDACWPWTGTIEKDGYGQTNWHKHSERAHRVAYEELVAAIPDGLVVDHACHVPDLCRLGSACPHRRCVNPHHMELTTSEDNVRKGRCYEAEQTRCIRGHSLGSDGDVWTHPDPAVNRRMCRVCDRIRKEAYARGDSGKVAA